MPEQKISQSLNKAYRQNKIAKADFDRFKENLQHLFYQINANEREEKLKGDVTDFLKVAFYAPTYKIAPNGWMDCVIHTGDHADTPIGVVLEVKAPNAPDRISREELNRKALQELILYYLRERVEKKNIQLKYLVATNIYEYFIFDAHEFERLFFSNKKLLKEFADFSAGSLSGNTTDFFYKEVAAKKEITYTYFDLRDYQDHLNKGNDRKLIELYKIFSPTHLLKLPFQNDSNSLNKNFYAELLHIMGLEEVGDKGKRIITRKSTTERCEASLIENTINVLVAYNRIRYILL